MLGPRVRLSLHGRKPADPPSTLQPREGPSGAGGSRTPTKATSDSCGGSGCGMGSTQTCAHPPSPACCRERRSAQVTAAKRRDEQCYPQRPSTPTPRPVPVPSEQPVESAESCVACLCVQSVPSPGTRLASLGVEQCTRTHAPCKGLTPPGGEERRGTRQAPVSVPKAGRDVCTAPRFKVKVAARVGKVHRLELLLGQGCPRGGLADSSLQSPNRDTRSCRSPAIPLRVRARGAGLRVLRKPVPESSAASFPATAEPRERIKGTWSARTMRC